MNKALLLLIIPILLLSCQDKELEEQYIQLQNEVSKSRTIIDNYESQIDVLKQDLDKMTFDLELKRVSEDYADNEFLVFDGQSYIPKGFAITEGYLRIISGSDVGIANDEMHDGLIFYITDKESTLNKYIANVAENKIFFQEDTLGNMGLTVHADESIKEELLNGTTDNPVKVILTLQDIFPMNGPAFFPFATVHLAESVLTE